MLLSLWQAFPRSSLRSGKWPCRICSATRWPGSELDGDVFVINIIVVGCKMGLWNVVYSSVEDPAVVYTVVRSR